MVGVFVAGFMLSEGIFLGEADFSQDGGFNGR